jgi:hypothetical protein
MTPDLLAARDVARMTVGVATWRTLPQRERLTLISDALDEIRRHRATGGACCA